MQRFDGRKFIQFSNIKPGSDHMPDARLYQIIPVDSGKLLPAFTAIREFGIFNPSNFTYKKIPLKTLTDIPARVEFYAWRDSEGQVCLNILHYGILQFDKKEHSFMDNNPFPLPKGWHNTLYGIHDDPIKNNYGSVQIAGYVFTTGQVKNVDQKL